MDEQTIRYYDEHARETAARYRALPTDQINAWIEKYVTQPIDVLDVAVGSGRDLEIFARRNCRIVGVDASAAMLEQAQAQYPLLRGRIHQDTLPELHTLGPLQFDVVLALAVLMHLPDEEFVPCLKRLSSLTRPRGILLVSIPLYRQQFSMRLPDGRLANNVTTRLVSEELSKSCFVILEMCALPDPFHDSQRSWSRLTLQKLER